MKKFSDIIQRTYSKIIKPFFEIEVLSENGTWESIDSLNITPEQDVYEIRTSDEIILRCAKDHILIDEYDNEVLAVDSLYKNIKNINGKCSTIISIKKLKHQEELYDLSLSGNKHTYFTNGLLSHNCVILDEFAFLQKNIADKLFTSMFPVISSAKNGKIIIVSTPNGTGNLYYDIWKQANSKDKNEGGWTPFLMYWWQVPGHDEEWKKAQIAAIGKERFAQEFNNEFLAGSSFHKLIPDDIIEKFRIRNEEYKLKKMYPHKDLQIIIPNVDKVFEFRMWFEFKKDHAYIASGDVAEGNGGDSSVIYIWDVTHLDQIKLCAKFSSNRILPLEFAYVTNKMLNLYGNPYYICEANGVGKAYLDALRITYEYTNIVREDTDNGFGVRSHVQLKGKACLWLQEMFTTEGFDWIIPDNELLSEMNTFVKKDTKIHISYAAMTNAHDDHIMTLCWAAWLLNPDIIEKYNIVVETFTSSLDKILPKTLHPYFEYTQNDLNKIYSDPIYKQYLDFKEEFINKYMLELKMEKYNNNNIDPFTLAKMQEKTIDELKTERNKILNNSNSQQYKPSFSGKSFYIPGSSSELFDDDDGDCW